MGHDHGHDGAFGRRQFVRGVAGVAAAAGAGGSLVAAEAAKAHGQGAKRRHHGGLAPMIDVHAHFLPPDYREALIRNGHAQPDGFPVLPTWSPESHLAALDQLGIRTAVLSVSSPGVAFGEDPVVWSRRVNEVGAATVRAHPGRFGLFAALPLPNVDAALEELRYALDRLDADGIGVLTNVNGVYLGDDSLEPLWAELNRRKAVVFMHPSSPACWEETSLGHPRPLIEFLFDTTRTIVDLVITGTLARYPDVRLIVPHSGATLPVLADRVAALAGTFPLGGRQPGEIDVLGTLQRLYYEIGAGAPFPRHVAALLDLVDVSRLLFGTDIPFAAVPGVQANIAALAETELLTDEEKRRVVRDNALSLLPRLR
jgi:predicted TIM-barrel fold metal-dependent hydrolase